MCSDRRDEIRNVEEKFVHPVKGKIGDIFSVSIVITFHVDLFHLLILFQMFAFYSLGWLISIAYDFV